MVNGKYKATTKDDLDRECQEKHGTYYIYDPKLEMCVLSAEGYTRQNEAKRAKEQEERNRQLQTGERTILEPTVLEPTSKGHTILYMQTYHDQIPRTGKTHIPMSSTSSSKWLREQQRKRRNHRP